MNIKRKKRNLSVMKVLSTVENLNFNVASRGASLSQNLCHLSLAQAQADYPLLPLTVPSAALVPIDSHCPDIE